MERKTQKGYLLLADISGYTSFVARTEIEHAEKAISILLEAVIEKLANLFTIAKLEGDAVFAYLPEDQLASCNTLFDLIDNTYSTFRDSAYALQNRATCPCKACQAILSLDIKFLVHHGEYILQHVAGIRDLLGSDVTLIHRLAKNSVSESMGWHGYILLTDQSLECMQASKKPFIVQSETYEHLGDVQTYIMDLHSRYDEMKK
ncbi:MAG TPA: DUF2652 domain-containing protein [Anaerolineales bacterium]|nr:DUF2652 domain-containing protein [Anaerolineales bacterium]HNA89100.1 DUF2652 domain-containing protein [Anaerolineales bacterium]